MKTNQPFGQKAVWLIFSAILIFVIVAFTAACKKDDPAPDDDLPEEVVELQEEVGSLITKIENYVASGNLNAGIANSLISKLQNAQKSLEKGNLNAAISQLQTCLKQIEDLVKKGDIDQTVGEELIAGIRLMIEEAGQQ